METRKSYEWQQPYEVAIVETDRTHLPALITAAQAAIDTRMTEIRSSRSVTPAEMQAIEDAGSGLRILIAESRAL